jgi:predicted RNA methylase
LELGAGAGLSGIVCSKFAKRTILTDGNQIVFDLLKRNCLLYPNKTEAFLLNWGKT